MPAFGVPRGSSHDILGERSDQCTGYAFDQTEQFFIVIQFLLPLLFKRT